MSDDTPSPLNNVITIDDERIKSHLDRVADVRAPFVLEREFQSVSWVRCILVGPAGGGGGWQSESRLARMFLLECSLLSHLRQQRLQLTFQPIMSFG